MNTRKWMFLFTFLPFGVFSLVENALRSTVMVPPVRTVEMVQADRAAGGRRVHESPLADVDSDVADAAAAAEKHQVGGGQTVRVDPWPLPGGQLARTARQAQVQHVPIDVIDQPAAVEPAFGRAAAVARSEEHTSELQSPCNLVCRLLLE